jgi:hypothetical protein
MLVIKAPELEPERDSPSTDGGYNGAEDSPSLSQGSLLQHDVDNLQPRDGMSQYYGTDLSPRLAAFPDAPSTSPSVHSDPINHSTSFAPERRLAASRSDPLLSISLHSPIHASARARVPSHEHHALKSHSRRSLIPTPMGWHRSLEESTTGQEMNRQTAQFTGDVGANQDV